MIAGQIPVEPWTRVVGGTTIAHAALHRIDHDVHRIELKVESEHRRNKPPPPYGACGAVPGGTARGPTAVC